MTSNSDALADSSKNHSASVFLSILLDMNGFSFYISGLSDLSDARKKGSYTFDNSDKNPKELAYFLKKKLRILDHGLRINKVALVYNHHLFALVPKDVFDAKYCRDYLKYTSQTFKTDVFKHELVASTPIVNVFIPLMNIHNLLLERYGSFEYRHVSFYILPFQLKQNFINTSTELKEVKAPLSLEHTPDFKTRLSIWCFETHIIIVGARSGQLNFYNNFDFSSFIDIIYYVLHVLSEQHMEASQSELVLYQSHNNELLELLQKYITPKVSFAPDSAQIHQHIHQI